MKFTGLHILQRQMGVPGWQRTTKAICLHACTVNIKFIMSASIFTMYGPRSAWSRLVYLCFAVFSPVLLWLPSHGQCDSNYHEKAATTAQARRLQNTGVTPINVNTTMQKRVWKLVEPILPYFCTWSVTVM